MKLTIVIPALNEEEAIGSTIERCLAARKTIKKNSPVSSVEIIVVSDGSTDRTPDIAAEYHDIQLIVFETNQGYGAAIKKGFAESKGELVAFLDADGTCDPEFFAHLCTELSEKGCDVAIGSRMNPQSKMPKIRRLGNRIYATILSLLSNRVVTDTASGMRVIRRDAIEQLYPLPDGLHFTPAMSARVLMDDHLKIAEIPMPYEERVGDSKLRVLHDGMRFLRTILEMTLMWRPARLFLATAAICLTIMAGLALYPLESWLRVGRFGDDMIYRLLFCSLLGTVGVVALSGAVLSGLIHRLLNGRDLAKTFAQSTIDRLYTFRGVAMTAALASPVLAWLVGPGVWSRITEGIVSLHWSRVVLAGLIVFALVQMTISILIANIIRFHIARKTIPSSPRKLSQKTAKARTVRPGRAARATAKS